LATRFAEDNQITPGPETIKKIGEGWVAEEALAISCYCALVSESDFARGVRLAVNHDGDSDSTGAITGNILGALLGKSVIPSEWLEELEMRDVIEEVARDLLLTFEEGDAWLKKYPEW
jgi:ADP-ribosylglycohydrolase